MPTRAFTILFVLLAALPAAGASRGEARFLGYGRVFARMGKRP
jgi:hypothetical protein